MKGRCQTITNAEKRACVQRAVDGETYRSIYNSVDHGEMSFRTFSRRMADWKGKLLTDEKCLETANLGFRFAPKGSTVQVNAKGELERAWIKQNADDMWDELLQAIKTDVKPVQIDPPPYRSSDRMLEAPLFDMHFGVADLEYYKPVLAEILEIVRSRQWDKIVITVGQDLFHNDSINKGVTSKGTLIERVNMQKAVTDALAFYYALIDEAIRCSNSCEVTYSPGNHDKTVGWLFSEILKARYGSIVDTSPKQRKAIWWNECFIGITHGEKGNDTAAGLRGKFTKEFPALFATAKVREIHTGHLHREGESRDEYGIQIRRISTGNKDDEWTAEEGYMSHKKFMLFEWSTGRLRSIHYV